MLDPFTLLLLDDWEDEDSETERYSIAEQILDDWEEAIASSPDDSWELNISGEHIATYTGFQEIPDHGITLNEIMDYKPDVSLPEWNRMELSERIDERLQEISASKDTVSTEMVQTIKDIK